MESGGGEDGVWEEWCQATAEEVRTWSRGGAKKAGGEEVLRWTRGGDGMQERRRKTVDE